MYLQLTQCIYCIRSTQTFSHQCNLSHYFRLLSIRNILLSDSMLLSWLVQSSIFCMFQLLIATVTGLLFLANGAHSQGCIDVQSYCHGYCLSWQLGKKKKKSRPERNRKETEKNSPKQPPILLRQGHRVRRTPPSRQLLQGRSPQPVHSPLQQEVSREFHHLPADWSHREH